MRELFFGLILLATTSAFADDKSCTTVFGQKVCADVEQIENDIYIQNFEPNVPASKAIATILCEATGVEMPYTKVKFKTIKSANGDRALSQVRCKHKEKRRVGQWI